MSLIMLSSCQGSSQRRYVPDELEPTPIPTTKGSSTDRHLQAVIESKSLGGQTSLLVTDPTCSSTHSPFASATDWNIFATEEEQKSMAVFLKQDFSITGEPDTPVLSVFTLLPLPIYRLFEKVVGKSHLEEVMPVLYFVSIPLMPEVFAYIAQQGRMITIADPAVYATNRWALLQYLLGSGLGDIRRKVEKSLWSKDSFIAELKHWDFTEDQIALLLSYVVFESGPVEGVPNLIDTTYVSGCNCSVAGFPMLLPSVEDLKNRVGAQAGGLDEIWERTKKGRVGACSDACLVPTPVPAPISGSVTPTSTPGVEVGVTPTSTPGVEVWATSSPPPPPPPPPLIPTLNVRICYGKYLLTDFARLYPEKRTVGRILAFFSHNLVPPQFKETIPPSPGIPFVRHRIKGPIHLTFESDDGHTLHTKSDGFHYVDDETLAQTEVEYQTMAKDTIQIMVVDDARITAVVGGELEFGTQKFRLVPQKNIPTQPIGHIEPAKNLAIACHERELTVFKNGVIDMMSGGQFVGHTQFWLDMIEH